MDPEATANFLAYFFPLMIFIAVMIASFFIGFLSGYLYSKSEEFWRRLARRLKLGNGL